MEGSSSVTGADHLDDLLNDREVISVIVDAARAAYLLEHGAIHQYDPRACIGQGVYRSLVRGLGRLEGLGWHWYLRRNAVWVDSPEGRYRRPIRLVVWAGRHVPPSIFEVNRKGPVSKQHIKSNHELLSGQVPLWPSDAPNNDPLTVPIIHSIDGRRLQVHLALGMELARRGHFTVLTGLVAVRTLIDGDVGDESIGIGATLPLRVDRPRPVPIRVVVEAADKAGEGTGAG